MQRPFTGLGLPFPSLLVISTKDETESPQLSLSIGRVLAVCAIVFAAASNDASASPSGESRLFFTAAFSTLIPVKFRYETRYALAWNFLHSVNLLSRVSLAYEISVLPRRCVAQVFLSPRLFGSELKRFKQIKRLNESYLISR